MRPRGFRALLAAGLLSLTTGPAAATSAKPRILSINPCVDAVLLEVADPAQIVAISHYSHDPRATSVPLAQARRFPATAGTAEEVLARQPDLVIAGPHVDLATIRALRRLGIPLMQLSVPATIGESKQQVRQIAKAAGQTRRGARLVARITAALDRAAATPTVPALIWQGGGMVPGAGTLADDLLTRTGFRNMSSAYGLQQWDILPLELLVARPPAVLLTGSGGEGADNRLLVHPVVHRLGDRITVRDFPARLLHCGGPTLIAASAHLRTVRESLKVTP